MNKIEYIKEIEKYLKNKMKDDEIYEIMRDYIEFFEEGKKQGKTEQDIIHSLGSAEHIANEILGNETKENPIHKIREKVKKMKVEKPPKAPKMEKATKTPKQKKTSFDDDFLKNIAGVILATFVYPMMFIMFLTGVGLITSFVVGISLSSFFGVFVTLETLLLIMAFGLSVFFFGVGIATLAILLFNGYNKVFFPKRTKRISPTPIQNDLKSTVEKEEIIQEVVEIMDEKDVEVIETKILKQGDENDA